MVQKASSRYNPGYSDGSGYYDWEAARKHLARKAVHRRLSRYERFGGDVLFGGDEEFRASQHGMDLRDYRMSGEASINMQRLKKFVNDLRQNPSKDKWGILSRPAVWGILSRRH